MSQELINILLGAAIASMPFVQFFLNRYFPTKIEKQEGNMDYADKLLKIANDSTEALRKSREEQIIADEKHEEALKSMRKESSASSAALRAEYDSQLIRLKRRIEELEQIQKVYQINFDLVTHPNLEIKNIDARAVDDVKASQKLKAINVDQQKKV